jgi:sugar/nucleoside kinase (ribokinase family)
VIDYFTLSLIIDDIVLPDGRTQMGLLGGGGPQTAFGMKLWAAGGVGLCAGVGPDFPPAAQAWLDALGIDTQGVRRHPQHPTLRAWQVLEEDGRRTQVWRTPPAAMGAQLAFTLADVPPAYWGARGFHFGVHPERPNLAVAQALRSRGVTVSIEPFRAAAHPLSSAELAALLGSCDIFSPNAEEACSLVGEGDPPALVQRLGAAGAGIVALRLGAAGSLIHRAATGELIHVPAVPVTIVDPVGAGNAYCGAFLVGWLETGDLRRAGQYAAVAASFMMEQYGLPPTSPTLPAEARARSRRPHAPTMKCTGVAVFTPVSPP